MGLQELEQRPPPIGSGCVAIEQPGLYEVRDLPYHGHALS